MGLLKKQKVSQSSRSQRLQRQFKATTQKTIRFERLDEDGHMAIGNNRYSHTYKLGDATYTTASHDKKVEIIDTYADALNLLEKDTNYQLLVTARKLPERAVEAVHYNLQGDSYDVYRQEYNTLMNDRFEKNAKSFEVNKYITLAIDGFDDDHARRQFHDISIQLIDQFKKIDVPLKHLNGVERLALFSELLRHTKDFPYDYNDIRESGIGEKSFIAPNSMNIFEKYIEIDDKFSKIMYIRHFPKSMSDKLIYYLTNLGIELDILLSAGVYDTNDVLNEINDAETNATFGLIKSQQKAIQQGTILSEELIGSTKDKNTIDATSKWRDEIREYDQKIYKGLIAVHFKADSLEELEVYENSIERAGGALGIRFETIRYYQEDALNTVLPIGECFIDVRQQLTRKMTTSNVATQVPFTQVDLISESPKALYYGQNQLSNNMITVDRKRDLLTGSGLIFGVSGSGKSFAVKLNEIIPNKLRNPQDRIIIVDPEDEYSDIGSPFDAQLIDISIGTQTHINLLDLPNFDNLDSKDAKDPIGNKANLLTSIFDTVLDDLTNEEITMIDRVTRQVYQLYERPTMVEWHNVLLQQNEEVAQSLALKVEIYTIGSQNIFSHPTNVDLENQLVIFNLKHLSGKLKPFALLVIQDFIWNQVVENKGKHTTWIYFDELQLYFRTHEQAVFFTELYSRIRKYGAIPTGITQNVETIYAIEEGRKLLSNSEFMMILKQKDTDISVLKEVITITDEQIKYIRSPKDKGTGIIYAGGVIIPFENPIPKDYQLYKIIETDA